MAKPAVTAPIASASTVPQLEEIMGAVNVALDAGDVAALDGGRARVTVTAFRATCPAARRKERKRPR